MMGRALLQAEQSRYTKHASPCTLKRLQKPQPALLTCFTAVRLHTDPVRVPLRCLLVFMVMLFSRYAFSGSSRPGLLYSAPACMTRRKEASTPVHNQLNPKPS